MNILSTLSPQFYTGLSDVTPLPPILDIADDVSDYLLGIDGEPDIVIGLRLIASFLIHGMVPILDACGRLDGGSVLRESGVYLLQNEERIVGRIAEDPALENACDFFLNAVERLDALAEYQMGSAECCKVAKEVLFRVLDILNAINVPDIHKSVSMLLQNL